MRASLRRLGCLLAATLVTSQSTAEEQLPSVPDGFTIEKVAASPLVKHPMLAGFDDRGRLFVAESAGQNLRHTELLKDPPNFMRLLEDTNGDGVFDKSTIFADKMTLPMGALWYRGGLYVASPPNIWRLEDTDDDGVADRRTVLVDTFGFSGNAASVHGCFLGPNGRIYWCDGRHGHEFADDEGNVTSKGKAARIFSCRPFGNDVQVFCGGGMDNPVEIDFTPEGEMLGTVNILLGKPRVDCLMHWMDGGVYPRHDQEDCIAEFPRTGDLLPPMTRLGHVAVSGMTRYRSDQFGPEFQDNVFTTLFNTHRVIRSVLKRDGSTFTTMEEDFLVSDDPDFHPTDVLEDADGSLLVIDTGGWFRIGCPTSQVAKPEIHGAIYRVRLKNARQVDDPRGLKLDFASTSPEDFLDLLSDRRPAVRERATDRLAQFGLDAVPGLTKVLKGETRSGRTMTGRRNAVWALSRIAPEASPGALSIALDDESESVRLAAARSVGTNRDTFAVEKLAQLVVSDTPAIRREAATALGRICEPERTRYALRVYHPGEPAVAGVTDQHRRQAVAALIEGFKKPPIDRVLEHALIYALIRIADRDRTVVHLDDANPQVRRAVLIALDQMHDGNLTRELVAPLLDTDDGALQQTALDVISRREGWAEEMLGLLEQWLADDSLTPQRSRMLRGVLLAQAADAEIQRLIGETIQRDGTSPGAKLLMLEVATRAVLEDFPQTWLRPLERALQSERAAVQLQAVRVVGEHQLEQFDAKLRALSRSEQTPAETRIAALEAVAERMQSPLDDGTFQFVLDRLQADTSPLDRLAAARALAASPLDDGQLHLLVDALEPAGPLAAPVLLRAFGRSADERVGRKLVATLNGSTVAANLSADELANLLKLYPAGVQRQAAPLLKRLGVDLEQQRIRLEDLSALTTDGDTQRGRELFFGKKAACGSCHTVGSEGGQVGPVLTQIGRIRTGRDLLEAVVFPSASFARGFRSYSVLTEEGKVHTGIITRETAEVVTLRTAQLAEVRIPRSGIEEMRESPVSIMPKGMDETLSADELRDLLAFLQAQK